MGNRARMEGVDVYVVYWRGGGASGWIGFTNRREADLYASKERKFYGKGKCKIRKRICRVPSEVAKDFAGTHHNNAVADAVTNFISENYPHCVGED